MGPKGAIAKVSLNTKHEVAAKEHKMEDVRTLSQKVQLQFFSKK